MTIVTPEASTLAVQAATLRAAADLLDRLPSNLPAASISAWEHDPAAIRIGLPHAKEPVALARLLKWVDALGIPTYDQHLGSTRRFSGQTVIDGRKVHVTASYYEAGSTAAVRTVTL